MLRKTTRAIRALIIGLAVAGCGAQAAPTTPALTPRPTSPAAARSSPIPPAATRTAPTPAAIPTAAAPTTAPEPTAADPGSAGAAWPDPTATPPFPEQQITAGTAGRVELLRTVGVGLALDAAFSPDGRLLAVATSGGIAWYELPGMRSLRFDAFADGATVIRFIDSQTVETVTDLVPDADRVEKRLVADGSLIESRSENNAMPDWVKSVESPAGGSVASFPPLDWEPVFGVKIVRQADGVTLYEDQETRRLDFAADGASVALVTEQGGVRIVNLLTGQADEIGLPGYSAAAFSPDGQTLVTAGRDLALWDVVSGELKQRDPIAFASPFGMRGTTQRISYSPDGSELTLDGSYTVFEGEIRLSSAWNIIPRGVEFAGDTLIGGRGVVNHQTYVGAISPAGRAGAYTSDGTTLEIHRDGALLHTLTWASPISGLAFSPDGATLAVGDKQGGVRLVVVEDGSVGETFGTAGNAMRFAFSPDSTLLAVAGDQGAVELIAVSDGSVRGKIGLGAVAQFSFSPDGARLAARTEDGAIRMINVAAPQNSHMIPSEEGAGPGQSARMIFTADSNLLLVSDANGVRFYDPVDTRLLHTLPATGDDIAIGPNRRMLLVLRDGYVQLWGIR